MTKLPNFLKAFATLTFTILVALTFFPSNASASLFTGSRFLPMSSDTTYSPMSMPLGLAKDASGNIYVIDSQLNYVFKYDSNGVLITRWGGTGTGDGQFQNPVDIAVDTAGNVYVPDESGSLNIRVQKFDSNGNFILRFGSFGTGNGQFQSIGAITTDSSNNVFVFDNARIEKFDSNGNYITKWGSSGTGNGQFSDCEAMATDGAGNVYTVERGNHRVQKFSNNGVHQLSFGVLGTSDGQLSRPTAITVDSSNNIFVGDIDHSGIQKFTNTGTFISKFGTSGANDGEILYPAALVLDGSGNVYVVDSQMGRVQKYNSSGSMTLYWGSESHSEGKFRFPQQIIVDHAGNMYVSQTDGYIDKYNSSGSFLFRVGSYGTGDGQFSSLGGIAVDSNNNLYVVDLDGNRIEKFNSSGVYQTQWGSYGVGNGEFAFPYDIAIDSNDNVYTTEFDGCRVQKFNSNGVYQSQWGSYGTGNGEFDCTLGIKIALDNSDNVLVAEPMTNRIQKFTNSGGYLLQWGSTGTGNGQFDRISGINHDSANNIYVLDWTGIIQKFDTNGNYINEFGGFGLVYGTFFGVSSIAVDSADNLFVLSTIGGDEGYVTKWVLGNQIVNLSSPLDAVSPDGSLKTVAVSKSPNESVTLEVSNMPASTLTVNMTSDRDWSLVTADIDLISGKAILSNLNPVDAPGASATHSLYIPKLEGQNSVYICPNATQLSEVSLSCSGGYTISSGAANLTVTNVTGQDYWVVSGLTGTGGLGQSLVVPSSPLVLTPNNSAVSASQEVTMSYTPASGFVSGDKVQLHFEPTAGFVLANTCATPTTDSNADSTVDGSATIVGSDVYEYTFSGTVAAGPLSFCALVTSPATAGSYSVRLTDDNGSFGATMYYVGGDNEVFVIANVAPSLSFNIRTLADDADTNVCSFGTVSPSDTLPNYDNVDDGASECGYALAVGTNAANGFQVQITADNQLNGTSGNIADISNGGTFSSGVESYGLANVTSSTSGRNVTTGGYTESILRNGNFNLGANTGTNIPLSATNFVSYTNGIQYVAGVDSLDTTSVMHGLVIGSGTPAGYYDQVLTYTTTANF